MCGSSQGGGVQNCEPWRGGVKLGNSNKNLLNIEIEICPIAISTAEYNLRITNLIEHLLILDQNRIEVDKAIEGVAWRK